MNFRTSPAECAPVDANAREICIYLKGWRGQFVGLAEITQRAAGKHRCKEDAKWAMPVLNRLVEKGVIESDSTGHDRLKPLPRQEKQKCWLAPHVRKALEASRQFEGVLEVDQEEQF